MRAELPLEWAVVTHREQEVLELSATGLPAKRVGRLLGIAPRTVEQHLANLRVKLGARNRSQLVAAAVSRGLLT